MIYCIVNDQDWIQTHKYSAVDCTSPAINTTLRNLTISCFVIAADKTDTFWCFSFCCHCTGLHYAVRYFCCFHHKTIIETLETVDWIIETLNKQNNSIQCKVRCLGVQQTIIDYIINQ